MGFDTRRLHVLAYAGGCTCWLYRLPEDELPRAAFNPDYFAAAGELVRPGDVVTMTGPDGGAVRCVVAGEAGIRLKALV